MRFPVTAAVVAAIGFMPVAAAAQGADEARLSALEISSHQQWLARDRDALARLMDRDFHLVVMNGAVETRAQVLGETEAGQHAAPPALVVRALVVEPDDVVVKADTGIVVSTMRIDASVQDRPLPPRMRVLSVFARSGEDWVLLARSITPIRQAPGAQ